MGPHNLGFRWRCELYPRLTNSVPLGLIRICFFVKYRGTIQISLAEKPYRSYFIGQTYRGHPDLRALEIMGEWKTAIEEPARSVQSAATGDCHTLEESIGFAPRRRPCYPQLVIVDDHSSDSGEVVRLRRESLSLGRIGCDLSFPAEALMSATHAKISLQETSPHHWDWILEDLSSSNGVFVRLTEFPLRPGNEFLLGGTRVKVHGDTQFNRKSNETMPFWSAYTSETEHVLSKSELEVCSYMFSQESCFLPLRGKRLQLGRLADAAKTLSADPFVEPTHVVIQKTDPHSWKVVDQKSLNGVWLRVRRAVLSQSTSFILGEQRFRFEFLDRT